VLTRISNSIRQAVISLFLRNAALFDGAGGGNRLARWFAIPASPGTHYDNPVQLRARAEGEFRNNPFGRKAVNAIVDAVWGGNGINPMFAHKETQSAWEEWAKDCDGAGRLDWTGLGAQILQTIIVSGEAFVLLTLDPSVDGIPLRLLVLGPEYLDLARVDKDTFAGIRYNGIREEGYWLYQRHPAFMNPIPVSMFVSSQDCLRLAKDIAPGAQRGQSWLAPALLPLRELNEYLESALVKSKVAALYAGFIRTADGSNPILNAKGEPTLEPGSMTRLQPGEEVNFTVPPDVGASFDPFVKAQLRRIAAGMGIPYEILSGDLSAVTFASGRSGLLEYRRAIESIQHGLLVPQFCRKIMQRWAALAAALGVIPQSAGPVRWIGPSLEMLDARHETQAKIQLVRAGFSSRTEIVASSGVRVEDIDVEIASDNARADAAGLVFDSDPRKTTLQGLASLQGGQGGQTA